MKILLHRNDKFVTHKFVIAIRQICHFYVTKLSFYITNLLFLCKKFAIYM
jgi:hypothetical protein